jgi:hypothetical protein
MWFFVQKLTGIHATMQSATLTECMQIWKLSGGGILLRPRFHFMQVSSSVLS